MTKNELLSLYISDCEYTKTELADAIDSIFPQLKATGLFNNFWENGKDFAKDSNISDEDISYVELMDNGIYDFNGSCVGYPQPNSKKVTLAEWVQAIREAFDLEA